MNFNELGLVPSLCARCAQLGFSEPTPIQKQAIPIVLNGGDIIATAETGTGKTAAFLLPIIQKLEASKLPGTTVLVISPTRELANQTDAACKQLAPKNIRSVAIIGGTGYRAQMAELRRNPHVLIATPGRLIDYMEQGLVDLSKVTTLVLDEADRM